MSYIISFFSGAVTLLSPCVLGVLPIIMGSALEKNRRGPLFIVTGLIASFSLFSVFFLFFQNDSLQAGLRIFGLSLLVISGILFLNTKLEALVQTYIFTPISAKVSSLQNLNTTQDSSFVWFFLLGMSLGVIWAPCTGSSLAIALGLASQSGNFLGAFLLFLSYGFGFGLPMLVLSYFFSNSMHKLLKLNSTTVIKKIMGAVILVMAIAMIFNVHHLLEAYLVSLLPDWWLNFITF